MPLSFDAIKIMIYEYLLLNFGFNYYVGVFEVPQLGKLSDVISLSTQMSAILTPLGSIMTNSFIHKTHSSWVQCSLISKSFLSIWFPLLSGSLFIDNLDFQAGCYKNEKKNKYDHACSQNHQKFKTSMSRKWEKCFLEFLKWIYHLHWMLNTYMYTRTNSAALYTPDISIFFYVFPIVHLIKQVYKRISPYPMSHR